MSENAAKLFAQSKIFNSSEQNIAPSSAKEDDYCHFKMATGQYNQQN